MKVRQHAYLSPAAMVLRARDRTRPWSVHVCEVDAFRPLGKLQPATFRSEVERVAALREALENDPLSTNAKRG